ncbi:hypothetical protein [Nostoc sp. ChiQUE01b]|uniref:hypothetical protein n=1 Tax=Nostoc sp. ChiQUE01b TaxID=3075376 RepID=UPI002AD3B117|nr:hypothetical protein [Nostoc sp. ChiQUE01b]MDZ8260311.1 hypothetical protein [Nostoc sp. ChiQUE01b]
MGALSGWVAWWFSKLELKQEKATQSAVALATEGVNERRNFNHLLGNYKQMSEAMTFGFNELEVMVRENRLELAEIKAYLIRNQGKQDQ